MGKKISVVLGTRPEAIKLAPVIRALKQSPDLQCSVCSTGQHRQMLDQVMRLFGISADADLDLMQPNQSLAALSARALVKLDAYYESERPDFVLVQGDTMTAFCAGLAAFYRRIPFGHVEAGLRTWNLSAPWPEEANRVLTSRLASVHFAPTAGARDNLIREGVEPSTITVTGNTVIDALFITLEQTRSNPPVIPELPLDLQPQGRLPASAPRVVLITGHRRENFGPAFENICSAIADLARRFPDVHFVYPVHLNPNVRTPVERILRCAEASNGNGRPSPTHTPALSSIAGNIHLTEPLAYAAFVALMDRAALILTDSGGVQEEAPSLGKPVLVMRDTTERPEAVAAGTVRLVGTDREAIVRAVSALLTDNSACAAMSRAHNPYGDGRASERIVRVCQRFLGEGAPASASSRVCMQGTKAA